MNLFCGGCNTIDKVTGYRLAGDAHFELIEMFKALNTGWIPPKEVSEAEYNHIHYQDCLSSLKGYVGFNLSFAGKWWGGYARGGIRNYGQEAHRNLTKQIPFLKGIEFYNCNYNELPIPSDSIIYCDPPYRNTTKYKDSINYEEFYQWCRDMKLRGHTIYIYLNILCQMTLSVYGVKNKLHPLPKILEVREL